MFARLRFLPIAALLIALAAHHAVAQGFFGELQMFEDGSKISLDVTLDASDVEATDSTGTDTSVTESKTESGAFRYEAILFNFGNPDSKRPKNNTMTFQVGVTGKRDQSNQTSASIQQDNDRKFSLAYAGFGFNDIGAEGFGFFVVASRSSRKNSFTYFDYREIQETEIDNQYGAMLSLGIILIGAVRGNQLIDLTIEDPGRPLISESYEFQFDGAIAGFHIHLDDEDSQFNGFFMRKKIPFTPGNALDLDEGVEEVRVLFLKFGGFVLKGKDTTRRQAFIGESLNEIREKEVEIGTELGSGVTISLKFNNTLNIQEFIRLNNPADTAKQDQ